MNERPRNPMPDAALLLGGDPGALEALYAEQLGEVAPVPRKAVGSDPGGIGQLALIEAYRARGFLAARLDPQRKGGRMARNTDHPAPQLTPPAEFGFAGAQRGPNREAGST